MHVCVTPSRRPSAASRPKAGAFWEGLATLKADCEMDTAVRAFICYSVAAMRPRRGPLPEPRADWALPDRTCVAWTFPAAVWPAKFLCSLEVQYAAAQFKFLIVDIFIIYCIIYTVFSKSKAFSARNSQIFSLRNLQPCLPGR